MIELRADTSLRAARTGDSVGDIGKQLSLLGLCGPGFKLSIAYRTVLS